MLSVVSEAPRISGQEVLQEMATQRDDCAGEVVDIVFHCAVPHQTSRGGPKLASSRADRVRLYRPHPRCPPTDRETRVWLARGRRRNSLRNKT